MSTTKNNLLRYQTVTSADMSADVTSQVTNIAHMDNIGYQINFTGANPVGTFEVQVSIDYNKDAQGNVTNAGNWISILNPPPVAIGAADNIYCDINQISAPWIRLIFTHSGGSAGTMNAFITGKSIG